MWRLIIVTFAFMGWGFYELSGGAEYEPRSGSLQAGDFTVFSVPEPVQTVAERKTPARKAPDEEIEVTRASLNLSDLPRVNVSLPTIAAPQGVQPSFEKARAVATPLPSPLEPAQPEPVRDIREISGTVVNMRVGPGTRFSIATKLRRGEAVEVLSDPGDGWLKLRVIETGRVGWMADYLVTASAD